MTRRFILGAMALALLAVGSKPVRRMAPQLIWNVSASAPPGFYVLGPVGDLKPGELVAVMLPDPYARFAVARGYVAPEIPILKQVAALPGQQICRSGSVVFVDGRHIADALDRDGLGREMPVWEGCHVLRAGEIFLLNPKARNSLDGRYFGPLPASVVIGRAVPIWIDPAPDEDGPVPASPPTTPSTTP